MLGKHHHTFSVEEVDAILGKYFGWVNSPYEIHLPIVG
jgi:hypothetical protein